MNKLSQEKITFYSLRENTDYLMYDLANLLGKVNRKIDQLNQAIDESPENESLRLELRILGRYRNTMYDHWRYMNCFANAAGPFDEIKSYE
jgi:hypothetical protein